MTYIRPKVLISDTSKVLVGCGNLYVTRSFDENKLVEMFLSLGKGGSCQTCLLEAIARLLAISLQGRFSVEETISQFKGLKCSTPVLGGASSCPDAIAKVLEEFLGIKVKVKASPPLDSAMEAIP